MASIDSFLSSSLQNLNNLNKKITSDGSDENLQKIVEYIYTLTEQLRYMLNNLDENNFTEGTIQNIVRSETDENMSLIEQTAYAINTQVKDVEGNVSTLEQTATGLTATVSGLKAAQDAVKVILDSTGLTIKNGGFKIVNSSNQTTMSVSTAGNIDIIGKYTSRAETISGSTYNAVLDGGSLKFYKGSSNIGGTYYNSTESALITQAKALIANDTVITSGTAYYGIMTQDSYGGAIILRDANKSKIGINIRAGLGDNCGSVSVRNTSTDKVVVQMRGNSGHGQLSIANSSGTTQIAEYISGSLANIYVRNSSGTNKITLQVDSSGNTGYLWADGYYNNSSRRYKKDITDMSDEQAQKLLDLKFVKFKYKDRDAYNYGLIAEDTPLDDVVVCDAEGRPDAIDYTKLIPYMGKLIQEQDKRIKALEMKQ